MKSLFVFYDGINPIEVRKGIFIKPFVVDKLCAQMITWKKGATFGPDKHVDEQIDFIFTGKMEWTIEDDSGVRKEIVVGGTALGLDPWVVHSGIALEDTVGVEIFFPSDRHKERARTLGLLMTELK